MRRVDSIIGWIRKASRAIFKNLNSLLSPFLVVLISSQFITDRFVYPIITVKFLASFSQMSKINQFNKMLLKFGLQYNMARQIIFLSMEMSLMKTSWYSVVCCPIEQSFFYLDQNSASVIIWAHIYWLNIVIFNFVPNRVPVDVRKFGFASTSAIKSGGLSFSSINFINFWWFACIKFSAFVYQLSTFLIFRFSYDFSFLQTSDQMHDVPFPDRLTFLLR